MRQDRQRFVQGWRDRRIRLMGTPARLHVRGLGRTAADHGTSYTSIKPSPVAPPTPES